MSRNGCIGEKNKEPQYQEFAPYLITANQTDRTNLLLLKKQIEMTVQYTKRSVVKS
jgi:hypothetical protein